jgi:hypothetical protein|nr:MAG TPA: hypothetical protein [Caudoviricetes sp.]
MRNIFRDLIDVQKYRKQRNTYKIKYEASEKEKKNLEKSRDMLRKSNKNLRKRIKELEDERTYRKSRKKTKRN